MYQNTPLITVAIHTTNGKKEKKEEYVEEDGKNAAARFYVCPVPSQHECLDIPTRKEGRFTAIVHPGGKHDM